MAMSVYGIVSRVVEQHCAGLGLRALVWFCASLLLASCAREQLPVNVGAKDLGRQRSAAPARASALGCSPAELAREPRRVITGLATYYADSLAGNSTASGDPYDPELLTAAHRTLPFGTRLRVRRASGPSPVLCVVVNDRGPFGNARRVLDLSRRAAEELEMLSAGVIPVRIEVL